jgi:hypothetical protein
MLEITPAVTALWRQYIRKAGRARAFPWGTGTRVKWQRRQTGSSTESLIFQSRTSTIANPHSRLQPVALTDVKYTLLISVFIVHLQTYIDRIFSLPQPAPPTRTRGSMMLDAQT